MKNVKGFTLVELVVVIAVIGILAAVTIVAYNQIAVRAQAAAISDGLQKVDKTMRIWGTFGNFVIWPEQTIDGGVPLTQLANDNPTLKKLLTDIPEVDGVHSEDWFYDNDGDFKTDCTEPYDGVNIVIRFVDDNTLAQLVDETIDDGDFNCGTVRYVDGRIFYTLSNTQQFNDARP